METMGLFFSFSFTCTSTIAIGRVQTQEMLFVFEELLLIELDAVRVWALGHFESFRGFGNVCIHILVSFGRGMYIHVFLIAHFGFEIFQLPHFVLQSWQNVFLFLELLLFVFENLIQISFVFRNVIRLQWGLLEVMFVRFVFDSLVEVIVVVELRCKHLMDWMLGFTHISWKV